MLNISKPFNILIVASDADYSAFSKRLGSRYCIYHSSRAADALVMMVGVSFDVLVATELLPDMPGTELIAKARQQDCRAACILIHEQFADTTDRTCAAEHLSKPVGEFTLMKALDDACARKEQLAS